jgi:hypothetical protein
VYYDLLDSCKELVEYKDKSRAGTSEKGRRQKEKAKVGVSAEESEG